jgi:uncharacterized membrane protein
MADDGDRFGEPVFAAVIRPHRSLDRDAFRILLILCGLASLAVSVPFVVLGVWPVAGFVGLDVLALFVAFKVNFRRGRSFEELVLTPIQLHVRHVSHRGTAREWRFNPLWTRIDREVDGEFGLLKLEIASRGETIVIARDLSPPERESLADELGRALASVKRGY